jgi:hypothetical protein
MTATPGTDHVQCILTLFNGKTMSDCFVVYSNHIYLRLFRYAFDPLNRAVLNSIRLKTTDNSGYDIVFGDTAFKRKISPCGEVSIHPNSGRIYYRIAVVNSTKLIYYILLQDGSNSIFGFEPFSLTGNNMKKILILIGCLIFTMSASGKTYSIKDVAKSLLSENTSRNFILQFKGSEAYESIKFQMYDMGLWKSMVASDDPLASFILLQHALANGKISKALDYAAITYVQTDQKEIPLQVIASLFSKREESDIRAAATYFLMAEANEQIKFHTRYIEYVEKYKVDTLKRESTILLQWLRTHQEEHRNHFVQYTNLDQRGSLN